MSQSLDRLRQALLANDELAAVDAGHELDVELIAGGFREAGVYSIVLGMLKALPQPQSAVGQRLVNLLRAHWNHVPPDVLADARAFCESATEQFVDAGAYQAMIELASGEWPGHVGASDV